MTKDRLEQYQKIKSEIGILENELSFIIRKGPDHVSDAVSTAAEFPYSQHTLVISGYDWGTYNDQIDAVYKKRRQKYNELCHELGAIEDYISGIDDSLIRQIIRLKYLDGVRTWRQVAQEIGGGNSENGVKQAFSRFMREQVKLVTLVTI